MKSFLLKEKVPIIKWGLLPDNVFFEGYIPLGYNLAVCPGKYIVLDVDIDFEKGKNGFSSIPIEILKELSKTFCYKTKRGGGHFWLNYTGNKVLLNKTSGLDIDLRVGQRGDNSGGYVKYTHDIDIRECLHLIKDTSIELNLFLEKLFICQEVNKLV